MSSQITNPKLDNNPLKVSSGQKVKLSNSSSGIAYIIIGRDNTVVGTPLLPGATEYLEDEVVWLYRNEEHLQKASIQVTTLTGLPGTSASREITNDKDGDPIIFISRNSAGDVIKHKTYKHTKDKDGVIIDTVVKTIV